MGVRLFQNTSRVSLIGLFSVAIVVLFVSYNALSISSPLTAPPVPSVPICSQSMRTKFTFDSDTEDVVILTAANEHFFDRMVNMIGSVHHWEPTLKVVAFDLGMTKKQVKLVQRMCNTEYLYPIIIKIIYFSNIIL